MKFVSGNNIPIHSTSNKNVIVVEKIEEIFYDTFECHVAGSVIHLEKIGNQYKVADGSLPYSFDVIVWKPGTKAQPGFYINESADTIGEKFDPVAIDNISSIEELIDLKEEVSSFTTSQLEDIQREKEVVAKVYKEFETLTNESREKLEEKFYALLNDEFSEYIKGAESTISDKIQIVEKSLVKTAHQFLEEEIEKAREELIYHVNENVTALEKHWSDTKVQYTSILNEKIEKLNKHLQKYKKQSKEEFDNTLITRFEPIQEKINNLEERVFVCPEDLISVKDDLAQQIKSLQEDVNHLPNNEKFLNVITAFEGANNKLDEKINNVSSEYKALVETTYKTLFDKIDFVLENSQKENIHIITERVKDSGGVDITKDLATFKDSLVKEVRSLVGRYVETYGGGTGTVAVQYANGGTINGSLNITNGQILSGGRDILDFLQSGGVPQTLSFDTGNANLTISSGNTVSLLALSGGSGGGGPETDPIFTAWAQAVSGNWVNTHGTVWVLSSGWQSTLSTVQTNSGDWENSYATVSSLSSTWGQTLTFNEGNSNLTISNGNTVSLSALSESGDTAIRALTAEWSNTSTVVQNNSSSWTQSLSFNSATSQLAISNGNTVTLTLTGGGSDSQTISFNESNAELSITNGNTISLSALSGSGGGSGDVVGPLSATDNAIVRFDTTTGKLIQQSGIAISDATTSVQNNVTITNIHEGQANSSIVIQPKGDGAFMLGAPPDGGSGGGPARGAYAVDLMLRKGAYAGHGATGNYSFAAGYYNIAAGNASVCLGYNGSTTNAFSFTMGNIAWANGYTAAAIGAETTANADYSHAFGNNTLANRIGMQAWAAGKFASQGDAQVGRVVFRRATTDATQTELTSDGGAPTGTAIATSNRFIIADGQAIGVDAFIVAKNDLGTKAAYYKRSCLIMREGSTTSLIGGVQIIGTDIESDPTWDVDLAADDTNESLQVLVTGAGATNIRWVCELQFREVSY